MKKAEDSLNHIKTGASSSLGRKWDSIDWDKAEEQVKRLQYRIAEAVEAGR